MVGYYGKFVYAKVMVEHLSPAISLIHKILPRKIRTKYTWECAGANKQKTCQVKHL